MNTTVMMILTEIRLQVKSTRYPFVCILFFVLGVASYSASLVSFSTATLSGPYNTVASLIDLLVLGFPLVGIVMGFDIASDDIETNRLMLLAAYPIRRISILVGKLLSRFTLGMTPVVAVLVVFYVFLIGGGIADAFGRFLILILVFGLGLGFWLSLASFASVWARSSAGSLLMSVAVLPIIAYSNISHLGDLILAIATGKINPSAAGFLSPSYSLAFVVSDFIPQSSINTVALSLFQVTESQFAFRSLWSWLTGYVGSYGVPNIVLITYLLLLTVLFVAISLVKFSRTQL